MIPLHRDPEYVFRFADARRIDRFHLDGVPAGAGVTVVDLATGAELARGTADAAGWVPLAAPLVVAAGGGFVARPAVTPAVPPPPPGPPP